MPIAARLLPFVALAMLPTPTLAAGTSAQADALIAAAKQAMGGAAWDSLVTWREADAVDAGGLQGAAESVEDLTNLKNRGTYSLGPVSGGAGWDGKEAWTTDSSKEVRIETSGEAVAQAIQDAYRGGYGFFFADRFPAGRDYVGQRQADGKTYDAVKITPAGAEPFEVWFDPSSHVVEREVQLTGGQPHTFLFSDFTRFGDILAPAKVIDRVGPDPKYDVVVSVKSIAFGGHESAGAFAPPPPPRNTAQWPAGKSSVTVPFRLLNNHIYVEASINGSLPLPFVFDTGATDDIQTSVASQLAIPVEGALPGGGFGDKLEDVGFARVKTVDIGGLTLPDQVFSTENSPQWVAVEGAPSSGLLGYEFAKRAVLTIDYAKRTMTFTKAEAFQPPRGAAAIPFTFDGHVPMLAGALDGFDGEFELDTGSRGALTVMRPFAEAHGLVAKYRATRLATTGYGVGGPSKALLARAGRLTIGPVSIETPVTEISTDKGGVAQSARIAGNIGGDLLKRFTVTLDYAHRTLWLQPNALAARPEVFDRSGLWIARAPDLGIEVADVATQSPAAAAGLTPGDEIVSVNGKPAEGVALYDLRERFKGAVGERFVLRVRSKGAERTVTLVLADQV
jgi:hypothetical protein